ncbi:hypothetical protein HK099_005081, partial [Clydaea vesicula]
MDSIGTGIVGAGLSAKIFHAPFVQNNKNFTLLKFLRSGSNNSVEGYETIPVTTNRKEFLETKNLDLVIITSPSSTHFEICDYFLKNNKNVVIEKPFTISFKESQVLIDTAKKFNLILAVYHNRIFDGDFITLENLIQRKILGNIVELESNLERFRNIPKVNSWRESDEPGSGILYDIGSHLIHQCIYLFGKPKSVFSILSNQRKFENVNSIDYFKIVLKFKNEENLIVTLKSSMLAKIPGPRFTLHGEKGSFTFSGIDPQEPQLRNKICKVGDENFGVFSDYGHLKYEVDGKDIEDVNFKITNGNYGLFYSNVYDAIISKNQSLLKVKVEDAALVIK